VGQPREWICFKITPWLAWLYSYIECTVLCLRKVTMLAYSGFLILLISEQPWSTSRSLYESVAIPITWVRSQNYTKQRNDEEIMILLHYCHKKSKGKSHNYKSYKYKGWCIHCSVHTHDCKVACFVPRSGNLIMHSHNHRLFWLSPDTAWNEYPYPISSICAEETHRRNHFGIQQNIHDWP
jgi:hypothetical protein